jgi:hypothetical protein
VLLVLHPSLAGGSLGITMSLLLGALSGAFAARALRCLRAAGGLHTSIPAAR